MYNPLKQGRDEKGRFSSEGRFGGRSTGWSLAYKALRSKFGPEEVITYKMSPRGALLKKGGFQFKTPRGKVILHPQPRSVFSPDEMKKWRGRTNEITGSSRNATADALKVIRLALRGQSSSRSQKRG